MFLMNSISNEYKLKLNFKTFSAYEIYNILKKTYTHEDNERIRILEKELDDLKFDEK